jgi:hypothetical protein
MSIPLLPAVISSSRSAGRRAVTSFLAILGLAAVPAVAGPLTITPTFDATIINDPNAATIEASINQVIAVYAAEFTNNITVNIKFQEMTSGLGGSTIPLASVSYSSFLSHLTASAADQNDATALASLPSTDPFGNDPVYLSYAEGLALGYSVPTGSDGTVWLNTSIMNLSRSSTNPSKYDLESVTMHEIDEILGLGSGLNGAFDIRPEDLFRYSASGVRSYSTSSSATAYFSIDGGVTSLDRFNQTGFSADYGDWIGTGTPQVQDAFGTPGAAPNLGVPELTALDVIGYTEEVGPEPSTIILFCSGLGFCVRRFRRR